jgi:hypothetical protein
MLEELFIEEVDFPHKNDQASTDISNSLNGLTDSSTIVYEAERTGYYRGVTNCNNERDRRHVEAIANTFAKRKEEEIGLTLVSHGWRSYRYRHRSGSRRWPHNGRWCTSTLTVQCYAIFKR